jgi:hypothetical protein
MTAGPSGQELQRREEERRRARAGIELVLGGPLFITAAVPIVISTGAPAAAGAVTTEASVGAPAVVTVRTIAANVGKVRVLYPRYLLPVAANAAIYKAAAEEVPPPDRESKLTPKENNFWDEYQAWAWGEDAINLTESVRHYLFWMDLSE